MKAKNRRVSNSILIRFKNMISSPAIKVTLVIAILASCLISFMPVFSKYLSDDSLSVYSDITLDLSAYDGKIIYVNLGKDADISITESNDLINIEVNTQDGYNAVNIITNSVKMKLLEKNIKNGNIKPAVADVIEGQNIKLAVADDIVKIDDNIASFLMMLTMIFFLIITLLVSRIGTQVAFEKGNKITETILTSITKPELYFSQVVASVMVSFISFVCASLPMIAAYIINDPEITSDFSFFTITGIIGFIFHLIVISIGMIIISIGIGSCVKKVEDANVITILILIPTLISYAYYIFTFDVYRGIWYFLNYIPLFSIYSVFGGMLRSTFSTGTTILYCVVDVIFTIVCYNVIKKVFCKHL